jgi:RNA polymerase sigma factor (sigma-70 family)
MAPAATSPVCIAYVEHGAALRRWIRRFTLGSDVEDIAQDAFLKAYCVELTRPIAQPKSFLFRIAKHVALNRLVRMRRVEYGEIEEPMDFSCPESELLGQEAWNHHLQAIQALPPGCRQVYWLRIHKDLSHKQIAAMLGIAVSTVEKHLIKADQRVRL